MWPSAPAASCRAAAEAAAARFGAARFGAAAGAAAAGFGFLLAGFLAAPSPAASGCAFAAFFLPFGGLMSSDTSSSSSSSSASATSAPSAPRIFCSAGTYAVVCVVAEQQVVSSKVLLSAAKGIDPLTSAQETACMHSAPHVASPGRPQ